MKTRTMLASFVALFLAVPLASQAHAQLAAADTFFAANGLAIQMGHEELVMANGSTSFSSPSLQR